MTVALACHRAVCFIPLAPIGSVAVSAGRLPAGAFGGLYHARCGLNRMLFFHGPGGPGGRGGDSGGPGSGPGEGPGGVPPPEGVDKVAKLREELAAAEKEAAEKEAARYEEVPRSFLYKLLVTGAGGFVWSVLSVSFYGVAFITALACATGGAAVVGPYAMVAVPVLGVMYWVSFIVWSKVMVPSKRLKNDEDQDKSS